MPKTLMLVVTKGPGAITGSIFNLFKTKGVKDPIIEASKIEQQILKPMIKLNEGSESKNLKLAKNPSIKP
jgi:hypothetical protein